MNTLNSLSNKSGAKHYNLFVCALTLGSSLRREYGPQSAICISTAAASGALPPAATGNTQACEKQIPRVVRDDKSAYGSARWGRAMLAPYKGKSGERSERFFLHFLAKQGFLVFGRLFPLVGNDARHRGRQTGISCAAASFHAFVQFLFA